jgi:hypothetical protein
MKPPPTCHVPHKKINIKCECFPPVKLLIDKLADEPRRVEEFFLSPTAEKRNLLNFIAKI